MTCLRGEKAVTLPQRVMVTLQLVQREKLTADITQLTHPGDKSKRSMDLLPTLPPVSYSKIIPNSRKTNERKRRHGDTLPGKRDDITAGKVGQLKCLPGG